MFVLNSEFIIGKYKWRGCNEVKITKSVFEYTDTAVIKLPATSVLRDTTNQTDSKQTAMRFVVGDKVSIKLGYNGKLNDEFTGFVRRINLKSPCEIECEGFSYILRTKKNIKKSWSEVSLKNVLAFITEGTDIKLHPSIPNLTLKNLKVNNASGTEVIDYLKTLLKGVLTVYFIGDTLYAGLAYMDLTHATVKHRLGWNVIKDDNLKQRNQADVKVKIELEYRKADGNQIVVSSGAEGGVVRREKMSAVTDIEKLQEIARIKLLQESFDGYEGDFETFLVPYVQPGYRCELSDPRYNERSGNYFVDSVETSFGMGGGRRKIQIGIKLS